MIQFKLPNFNFKAIPTEASELLPLFGTSSYRYITMTPKVPDWITSQTKATLRGAMELLMEPTIEIENRQGYEERTTTGMQFAI